MQPLAPNPPTLPLRVAPAVGEPLDSWLEAYARRLGIPLHDLLPAIGLAAGTMTGGYNRNHTLMLHEHEAAHVSAITGVHERQLHAMTLNVRRNGCGTRPRPSRGPPNGSVGSRQRLTVLSGVSGRTRRTLVSGLAPVMGIRVHPPSVLAR